MTAPANTTCTLIPCLRYRDAHAAIEWLGKAFGFQKNAVYADEQGGIAHAQLTFGNGMMMLGSIRDNTYGHNIAQPDQTGGRVTQSAYVVVADCKAHYQTPMITKTFALPRDDRLRLNEDQHFPPPCPAT
jgi:uncharacterized glyoxalase superfamily protein PhnB